MIGVRQEQSQQPQTIQTNGPKWWCGRQTQCQKRHWNPREREREQGDMAKRLTIRVEFPEPGLKRKNCQSSGAVEQGYISEFAGNNNAKWPCTATKISLGEKQKHPGVGMISWLCCTSTSRSLLQLSLLYSSIQFIFCNQHTTIKTVCVVTFFESGYQGGDPKESKNTANNAIE